MLNVTAAFLLLLFSLQVHAQPAKAQKAFLKQFEKLSGRSFSGDVLSPLKDNDPFKGQELLITVGTIANRQLRIPFAVGSDKSRTWVISLDETGLLLKHDHRHADGSPDAITNYGGYASAPGTALSQSFAADDFTAKLIPAAATNVWTIEFDHQKNTLDYLLRRNGELRFHARFFLSRPINP
jgi:hypothetical protein